VPSRGSTRIESVGVPPELATVGSLSVLTGSIDPVDATGSEATVSMLLGARSDWVLTGLVTSETEPESVPAGDVAVAVGSEDPPDVVPVAVESTVAVAVAVESAGSWEAPGAVGSLTLVSVTWVVGSVAV